MDELDDFTIGLLYIDANSNWDKNWLRAIIAVQIGAFGGTYDDDLTTFDFENFKLGLNSLYENLNSEIEFKDL